MRRWAATARSDIGLRRRTCVGCGMLVTVQLSRPPMPDDADGRERGVVLCVVSVGIRLHRVSRARSKPRMELERARGMRILIHCS